MTPAVAPQRPGETYAERVLRVNPPRESGLCPLCWPQQQRPSLCPPYGACAVCTRTAWDAPKGETP